MKYLFITLGAILGIAILIVGIAALFSLPVWLLWNWLMPSIFGLTKITWFQAWGLLVLCGFLFKANIDNTPKKD
jgi:hypothetical protein